VTQVLFLEETAQDPVQILEEVFDFIGLDLQDEDGEKVAFCAPVLTRWVGTIVGRKLE